MSMALLITAAWALGAPTAAELSAAWQHLLANGSKYLQGAIPMISAEEFDEIAAGDVIKQQVRRPGE